MELQFKDIKKEAKETREKLLVNAPHDLLECYVQQRIWLALKSGQCNENELFFFFLVTIT